MTKTITITLTAAIMSATACTALLASASKGSLPMSGSWKAPARWAKKKNPVPSTAKSVAAGKTLFTTNCVACHGPQGRGDGPAGAMLHPKPKDLSSAAIQSQSDGTLFWKISKGKKPMPSYSAKFSRRKRWELVDFIRTLAKGK